MIQLSGLEPGKDIEIVFTGIRDGEKLSEDLWNEGRHFQKTLHPDIYSEEGEDTLRGDKLNRAVEELVDLSRDGRWEEVINRMNQLIPNAELSKLRISDLTKISQ